MKIIKMLGRKLKGSAVVEAAIISPMVIIMMLYCLGIVTIEFMDSVRTVDFAVEEGKFNGVGLDNRKLSEIMVGVNDKGTEVELSLRADFEEDKLSGSLSAYDNSTNIKDILFSDDLEIDIGSYKVNNWLIARERLRFIYK